MHPDLIGMAKNTFAFQGFQTRADVQDEGNILVEGYDDY
jgi:hypothetical protein